ncbi:mercuric reductase [Flavobacterium sp. TAB 87]|uniref:mercuric reductase n=1 Tax=Flavobacterium sp. TAB 87 TaxID=1729581 RepID=UPI00076D8615|nr:mercuric reductase [Flavobacterium sp. TAB 87]KVV15112.1 Dihydrolipoyl dehydrogenase [Flavobacterium sp. TAB 87]
MIKVDAIIIGSGQAAKPLSLKLAGAGWKTVMVEKSEAELGGACLNVGCTPTKTLIASAKVMHGIKTAGKHGISVSDLSLDFATTQKRKDTIVADSKDGVKNRTADAENLELVYGTASFIGENAVVVKKKNGEEQEYTAPHIFIDAGTRPTIPKIRGIDTVKWYDSTGILALTEIPKKLIVIGGGYIGLEFGQMYSRFGSEVTVIERGDQIMSTEDFDVAESLQDLMEAEGMNFILGSAVEALEEANDAVTVTYSKDGKNHKITGTHLLLAVGRQSNADGLNTEAAGIALDKKGYVKVNGKLETNVKGVYAVGDINGGPQFTHVAFNDFVVLRNNLLEKIDSTTDGRIIPYTMYTDPQLGRVGLSENQAREQGLNFHVISIPGKRITRGIETGEPQGLWKALVDKDSGKILGAAIVCTEGGEIATVIQMAMEGGIPAKNLATGMFSHPAYSESLNTLFTELYKIK